MIETLDGEDCAEASLATPLHEGVDRCGRDGIAALRGEPVGLIHDDEPQAPHRAGQGEELLDEEADEALLIVPVEVEKVEDSGGPELGEPPALRRIGTARELSLPSVALTRT